MMLRSLKQFVTPLGVATFLSMSSQGTLAADTANIKYGVYIGATKMFKIAYSVSLNAKGYKAHMQLKPKGLAKLFANVTMVMDTSGSIRKRFVLPTSFSYFNKKKKRKRTTKVSWNGKSAPNVTRTWDIGAHKKGTLKGVVKPGLPDPITAFLRIGITDSGNPCSKTLRVFDGTKVYDLQMTYLKAAKFGKNDGGAYRGPAHKCRIRHKPVAGYSKKKMAAGLANPAIFHVWFAPVGSKSVNGNILIPVAASGKIKGRKFAAFVEKSNIVNGKLSP